MLNNNKNNSRTIFFGDVHGCFEELQRLWAKLEITATDRVYFVGDLINKGPFSFEVLKFVYEQKALVVLGNHELHFLNSTSKYPKSKLFQELQAQLAKYPEIMHWLKNLPYYIEERDFVVLHAGTVPDKHFSELTPVEITTLREINHNPWHDYYKDSKTIIYGHWAKQGLHLTPNTIGLDSGCVYGGKLTAYILEQNKFIQQKALMVYNPIKANF